MTNDNKQSSTRFAEGAFDAMGSGLEGDLQSPPVVIEPGDDAAPQLDTDELRREVEGIELAKGDVPDSEDRRTLHQYMRKRMLLSTELNRIKDQMKAMVRELENSINSLDYVYHPIVEPIVRRMLEGQERTKSVKTPYGTAGFRTENKGGKLVIVDPNALIAAKRAGRWAAYLNQRGNSRHLGLFDDEHQAARAYDAAAAAEYGQFAKLNFTYA
jgi:hypothetical protein